MLASAQHSLGITGITLGSVLRSSADQTVGNSEAGQPTLQHKQTTGELQALTALVTQGRDERVAPRAR